MTENIALLKLDDLNNFMQPTLESAQRFYDHVVSRKKWRIEPADRLDFIFTMSIVAVTLDAGNGQRIFNDMFTRFSEPVTQNEQQVILKRIAQYREETHDL